MATMIHRTAQRFIGLMCGSTLGYLWIVALGLVVTSWPFNSAFTPLAAAGLVVQGDYWLRICEGPGPIRQGVFGGLILMGALWLYYVLG